jgi:hypothetical protein
MAVQMCFIQPQRLVMIVAVAVTLHYTTKKQQQQQQLKHYSVCLFLCTNDIMFLCVAAIVTAAQSAAFAMLSVQPNAVCATVPLKPLLKSPQLKRVC